MALNISDAGVTISITKETRAPTKESFNILLFLDPTDDVTTRLVKYSSFSSVAAAYNAEDEAYKAASAYYGQSPSPKDFYVGNVLEGTPAIQAASAASDLTLTGTATDTLSTDITIDGESYSAITITQDVTTGADIVVELAALITANISSVFTATAAGDILTVRHKVAGVAGNASILTVTQASTGLSVTAGAFENGAETIPATSGENLANALDEILAIDSFYCVATTAHFNDIEEDVVEVAGWCEANDRIFFNTTTNALTKNVNDVTAIASVLKAAGYDRTMTVYSEFAGYPNVSAFGKLATVSYSGTNTLLTLKFKDLPGITVSDLSPNEHSIIKDKNCNVFYETATIRMFDDGITAGGSWIDDIAGMDALAEEIRVNVFGILSRSKKIPYTESGMSLLETEVETALLRFLTNGFLTSTFNADGDIVPAYDIWHIPVYQASAADKSNRIAPDINFVGTVAGAVHRISVIGTLVL